MPEYLKPSQVDPRAIPRPIKTHQSTSNRLESSKMPCRDLNEPPSSLSSRSRDLVGSTHPWLFPRRLGSKAVPETIEIPRYDTETSRAAEQDGGTQKVVVGTVR